MAPQVGVTILDSQARCDSCVRDHSHMVANPADANVWEKLFTNTKDTSLEQQIRQRVLEHDHQVWWERCKAWNEALPPKFRNADRMDDPLLAPALEHMKQGRPGRAGFMVRGGEGTGKTWLAMSYVKLLVRERLVDPGEVLVGSEAELLVSLTQQSQWEIGAALAKLTDPRWKVVFIDDVGVGLWRNEQTRVGAWHPLIDAMYAEDRTIVLSTGLTDSALRAHVGAAVFSRIRSMADGRLVSLSAPERLERDTPQALS